MIKKCINFMLSIGTGLFEFLIDVFIALVIIYITNLFFNLNIYLWIYNIIVLILGLTCGFNDLIQNYKKMNNDR